MLRWVVVAEIIEYFFSSLVLWAQSTTGDYIRAENKSVSRRSVQDSSEGVRATPAL